METTISKAEARQNLEQVKTVLKAVEGMDYADAHHALTHAAKLVAIAAQSNVPLAKTAALFAVVGEHILTNDIP